MVNGFVVSLTNEWAIVDFRQDSLSEAKIIENFNITQEEFKSKSKGYSGPLAEVLQNGCSEKLHKFTKNTPAVE